MGYDKLQPQQGGYYAAAGTGPEVHGEQPHQHHVGVNSHQEGYFPEKPKYQDKLFAVLFIAHLVALGGLLLIASTRPNKYDPFGQPTGSQYCWTDSSGNSICDSSSQDTNGGTATVSLFDMLRRVDLIAVIVAPFVVGALFAGVWVFLLRKFATQIIYITFGMAAALLLGCAALFAYLGSMGAAAIYAIFGALNILLPIIWKRRIKFASAMLKSVAKIIDQYPATVYSAFIMIFFKTAFVIVWVLATIFVLERMPSYALYLFLLFSLYWTILVMKNLIHTTVAGTVATWYFMSGSVGMPQDPTLKSFKRAGTTSFGSIAFGSMLVALLQVLGARARNNGSGCCASIMRYFNQYAYAQIAIYGKSFCEAAKDTWDLFMSRGITALIQDSIIGRALGMGALLGGLCGATVPVLIALRDVDMEHDWFFLFFVGLYGFMIGLAIVMVVMEVVHSGVIAMFVCWGMNPEALRANDPELHEKLSHYQAGIFC